MTDRGMATEQVYSVHAPGLIPVSINARMLPTARSARGKRRPGRPARRRVAGLAVTPEVRAYQRSLRLLALAELRRQGLWEPMTCTVAALVVMRGTKLDADNGSKDTLDALEGVAWVNDKQVRLLSCMASTRGQRGVEVHFGPVTLVSELDALRDAIFAALEAA